jgi:hypothetical protein
MTDIEAALHFLESIKKEVFSDVEQCPNTGDFTTLSALLAITIELLPKISWRNLSKKIIKRVKADVEVLLVSFKKLLNRLDQIGKTNQDLSKKLQFVFETFPPEACEQIARVPQHSVWPETTNGRLSIQPIPTTFHQSFKIFLRLVLSFWYKQMQTMRRPRSKLASTAKRSFLSLENQLTLSPLTSPCSWDSSTC